MGDLDSFSAAPRVWQVGALCRAIADALDARFNPVAVAGEISGFSKATSGHCYFTLKDDSGQIRCAMFRRAASALDFVPRDGDRVELRGRLGVYEPRGELQLVVESMRKAGQGTLFEQFLKLKAALQAQGLFDAERKRKLPATPRGIGLVTSLGAAALHDVVTTLQRRVPHIPVVIAPASVQGASAASEMVAALERLYGLAGARAAPAQEASHVCIDVILLVRGGGAMEDLWAFNDETLARTIAASPVPVISGVGHETDFTIADFVADLRAPTPTAAAELVALPAQSLLLAVDALQTKLQAAVERKLDQCEQRLDRLSSSLGRPSELASRQRLRLAALEHGLSSALTAGLHSKRSQLDRLQQVYPQAQQRALLCEQERVAKAALRLKLLDPSLVLQRGYAWLSDDVGGPLGSVTQFQPGQHVKATLADGVVDLGVRAVLHN
ncbi:exodeoxyribonuclease VII large subunit [Rhodoferax aquaticus]|uniref:Exodeoxyribonuclease 7 large subunit n=1 Tax=Rhodoferax aquaticus TaxID=2527691 RepID=A0A515EN36_9BURK|nr:exodeoxyribonuclease VII large subunit [Rhodoferax aquaticus]QDL54052.1 exodeoxyribonuclease VII large subunit [Rhodoferax aquaticus]